MLSSFSMTRADSSLSVHGVQGVPHLLLHQATHFQHPALQFLQIAVELGGNVMFKMRFIHI